MFRWIERKGTAPSDRAFYRIGTDELSRGREPLAAPSRANSPAGSRFTPGAGLPISLSMGKEGT